MKEFTFFREYLFAKHPMLHKSKELQWMFIGILSLWFFYDLISLFLSFCMQFSTDAIKQKKIWLALFFLGLYCIRTLVYSLYSILLDNLEDIYTEKSRIENKLLSLQILELCRQRVFEKTENGYEALSNSQLLTYFETFRLARFNFIRRTFTNCSSILLIPITFVGILVTTPISQQNLPIFILLLLTITSFYIYLLRKELQLKQEWFKFRKTNEPQEEEQSRDIICKPFVCTAQSRFRIQELISTTSLLLRKKRVINRQYNIYAVYKKATLAFAIIVLILLRIQEIEFEEIDTTFFLEIVAFISIFARLIEEVQHFISQLGIYISNILELNTYRSSLYNVLKHYDELQKNQAICIEAIKIHQFSFSYKDKEEKKVYTLSSDKSIHLNLGDCVMLSAPTGSGKTTFLKLITSYLRFDTVNIEYSPSISSTCIPKSAIISRDTELGFQNLLAELICSNKLPTKEQTEKLLEILQGVNLYHELKTKKEDVIDLLQNSKFTDFSSGQKNRFVLANLLYHLEAETTLLCFDEITSALDDNTAKTVMNFIISYCNRDRKRILIFSTHQLNLLRSFATQILKIENGKIVV